MSMSKHEAELYRAVKDYIGVGASSETAAQAEHLFGTGATCELEQKLAAYYGKRYALCVANATTGLLAIALALDLKNAEFITSPYTFGGSLASWLMLENKPVFADIDPVTLTIDPEKTSQVITKKTKAILAVDILGNPADAFALRKLADEAGVWYIADCAQSFGASRNGFPASHLADALVISFTSGKTLFAGEGGAIVTDNTDIYERLLFFSQHPFRQKRELGLETVNEFGFNGRIHPLAAIWANACFEESLKKLKIYQNECLQVIDCLNKSGLIKAADFREQDILPSFFRLTIELKKNSGTQKIESYLADRGFNAKIISVPVSLIYQNEAFRAQYKKRFALPKACLIAKRQVRQRIGLALIKKVLERKNK